MPRLPRLRAAEVLRALRRDGWQYSAQEGSHVQLKHPAKPGKITVPFHARQIIGPRLLSRILRQANLSAEEFRRLL
ncbi:MAG TPA: type II toxin-antitoxin system HicA family toxin [Chloroflexota bacterium]|nr:type II toxin-antitoxin system HicA family toxin [Chloroflexota bacterium]